MLQSFKLAISSILSNKMRSFLTMLGIIIGVAAVIILVSVVQGYMNDVTSSFRDMGVDRINVNLINLRTRHVDVDYMYDFYDENIEYFNYISPSVTLRGSVKNGNLDSSSTTVSGVSEDYGKITGYDTYSGRQLSYSDIARRAHTCVIGYYTAKYFFGNADDAVDEQLKINGSSFTVVGVIEVQDEDNLDDGEGGTDDFVWIPYSVAQKMGRSGYISNYILTVKDTNQSDEVVEKIEDHLYEVFLNDDLYTVSANSSMLDTLDSMIGTISTLLAGIAGISLLVAGIGVMNIMLVSVTERTREIGIRKALGARQKAILQQFVIEAAVTSSIGGIIGIFLGSAVTSAAGIILGFDCTPTFSAVFLSFSVSVAICIIFGYTPAKRAAKLHPVDALRSE